MLQPISITLYTVQRSSPVRATSPKISVISVATFMLLTWVPGLLNQQKLLRGRMRNSGKALLGLCCSRKEEKQVKGALARSLSWGQAGPLDGVRVGVGRGSHRRGALGDVPTPLVVLGVGMTCSPLVFFPTPQM